MSLRLRLYLGLTLLVVAAVASTGWLVLQLPPSQAESVLLGVTLVDSGLVLLFGILYLRRILGPLEALAARAREVADGKLEVDALTPELGVRNDEIARLCRDFDRMTASLRQQRDRLVVQEKLASIGRLAAGVAHEVGNPLGALSGYTDLLESQVDEEGKALCKRIREQIDRMSRIISELLDFARPNRGAPEAVLLRPAIERALSQLAPQKRFAQVKVDVAVEPMLAVQADLGRLDQVLVNLLANAADAMVGRGTITVAATPSTDRVEISVIDRGPGVPDTDRGRVFDPFFSTKDPGKGTGLGLAISRALAESWGGTLELAPQIVGQGAAFVLTLARARNP